MNAERCSLVLGQLVPAGLFVMLRYEDRNSRQILDGYM